jgi:hypothetical protein
VNIQGFDELLEDLNTALPELLAAAPSVGRTQAPTAGVIRTEVHDLQPARAKLDALDRALLRAKLLAYCEASRLPKPVLTDDAGTPTRFAPGLILSRRPPNRSSRFQNPQVRGARDFLGQLWYGRTGDCP